MMKPTINPNIEIRRSSIQGKGLFTKVPIKKDETIWISRGGEPSKSKIYNDKGFEKFKQWCIENDKEWDAVSLGNGKHRAAVSDRENHPENYGNHSCDPNLVKNHTALRDIEADEELTIDYAQFSTKDWKMGCNCGAKNCMGVVRGLL